MRKGDTRLKDECRYMVRRPNEVFLTEGQEPPEDAADRQDDPSQEELLKLPVHIPHRPKKDPRELKILDPACGSGHFLLYCFDLLLTIYEEAYDDPDLGPSSTGRLPDAGRPAAGTARTDPAAQPARHRHRPAGHPDRRPRPLAAVPAGLPGDGVEEGPAARSHKSNVVCAEPMPGEKEMLKEFVAQTRAEAAGPSRRGRLRQDEAGGRGWVATQDRRGDPRRSSRGEAAMADWSRRHADATVWRAEACRAAAAVRPYRDHRCPVLRAGRGEGRRCPPQLC